MCPEDEFAADLVAFERLSECAGDRLAEQMQAVTTELRQLLDLLPAC